MALCCMLYRTEYRDNTLSLMKIIISLRPPAKHPCPKLNTTLSSLRCSETHFMLSSDPNTPRNSQTVSVRTNVVCVCVCVCVRARTSVPVSSSACHWAASRRRCSLKMSWQRLRWRRFCTSCETIQRDSTAASGIILPPLSTNLVRPTCWLTAAPHIPVFPSLPNRYEGVFLL